jgi:large subunit ribosomal protein L4
MSALKQIVVDSSGKEVGAIELNPAVFAAAKINPSLVHTTVVWQRNKKRSGNHSCLTKAEVSGGGKKPWKQKGTGQARAGSNTSPLWVGGGRSHGPKPRDYTTRVAKRTRRQALISVLSEKLQNGSITVLDSLSIPSGKTKDATKLLSTLKLANQKVALLVSKKNLENNKSSSLPLRNIPGVKLLTVEGVNVYDLLNHGALLSTQDGLIELQDRLLKSGN